MTDSQVTELLARAKINYKDAAKRDILHTITTFRELLPGIERYVYANGDVKDLFTLNGTIPVQYRNSRYNIPVQFYLPENYPYQGPMCYVRPTQEMSINVNETVDANGRINVPYLQEWHFSNSSSNLSQLIYKLQAKFSEKTPLFSKSSRASSNVQYPASSNKSSSMTPYPTPTYPPVAPGNSSLPYPTQTPYPVATPYPSAQPTPYPTGQATPYPPSYPSQPAISTNTNTPFTGYPYQPGFVSMPTPSSSSNQAPSRPLPPPPPLPSHSQAQIPSYPSMTNTRPNYDDATIKPEYYKMSLITAIEDRVRNRLYDVIQETSGELESLRKSNHDLELGEKRLNNMIKEAGNEIEYVKKYTNELKQKIGILNENFGKMKHRDNSDIEDAVVAPAPLYRQIMQLFAEELAIQDLIFYLNEGISSKTVSIELFLKQVRFLSRRQFMVRALIQKCREHAGLRA